MLRSKSTPMINAPINSIPKSSSFADVHDFRRKAPHRATHVSTVPSLSTPNYSPLPSPNLWSDRQDPFNMGGFCSLSAQDDHSWKWIEEEIEEPESPTFQASPIIDPQVREKDIAHEIEDVIAEEDKLGVLALQLNKIWSSALPEGHQLPTAASMYPEDEPVDLDAVHAMHHKRRVTRPPTPETSFTSTSILFQPEAEEEATSQPDHWLGLIRRFVVQGYDTSGLLVKSQGH